MIRHIFKTRLGSTMFLSEFVYPGWWDFDNGATCKIDDVLTEHGSLLHVLPLAVHLQTDLTDK